jgi:dynein heavy chain
MDERYEWLASAIQRYLQVDTVSTDELFSHQDAVACADRFFSSQAVLTVFAVNNDYFARDGPGKEQDDGSDEDGEAAEVAAGVTHHQRLQLSSRMPTLQPGEGLRALFLLKTETLELTAADAAGWQKGQSRVEQAVEIFVTESPRLDSFQSALKQAFLPLLEDAPLRAARSLSDRDGGAGDDDLVVPTPVASSHKVAPLPPLTAEVVSLVQRLDNHISSFASQLSAERTLTMPKNELHIEDSEAGVDNVARNPDVMKEIEILTSQWRVEIQAALDEDPEKNDPLGEIEYWKRKYSALSGLYEQLMNHPKVKLILHIAKETDCGSFQTTLKPKVDELKKKYLIAKDNVKFLGTLDRHFRIIHNVTPESGTLQPIIDTMSSMMMAIRMVWIISRYYCTEENMMGLLEKIAALIADKVKIFVDTKTILEQPFDEARRKLEQGQQVLLKWKAAYVQVQKEINDSDREQHWVFDAKRLFDTTDYMAEKCADLLKMVSVLEYFHRLLGAQLKQCSRSKRASRS